MSAFRRYSQVKATVNGRPIKIAACERLTTSCILRFVSWLTATFSGPSFLSPPPHAPVFFCSSSLGLCRRALRRLSREKYSVEMENSSSWAESPRIRGDKKRSRTWFTMKVRARHPIWRRMRNEAPFADFEGRKSAVKVNSVAFFSFTASALASDMTCTGFGKMWKLTLGEGKERGRRRAELYLACRACKIVLNEGCQEVTPRAFYLQHRGLFPLHPPQLDSPARWRPMDSRRRYGSLLN